MRIMICFQVISGGFKGIFAIEIVSINDGKIIFNNMLTAINGMSSTPWLYTFFWNFDKAWHFAHVLEDIFNFNMLVNTRSNSGFEYFIVFFFYDKDNLIKTIF